MSFGSPPPAPALPVPPPAPTPPLVMGAQQAQGTKPGKKSMNPTFLGSTATPSPGETAAPMLVGQKKGNTLLGQA